MALPFAVAVARAEALAGDVGIVEHEGEEVLVVFDSGRLTAEPAGLPLGENSPLVSRVQRLLDRL